MHSGQESFARPRWRELPGGPRAPVFMARLRAAARQALCSLAGGHEPQEVSMARILVLYGTTEGHTARVADSIGATLRAHGDMADVVQASRPGPSPEDYSGIVIAASVHGGRYQTAVRRWVRMHAAVLGSKPTAFVSVCLGVLQHDPVVDRELAAIMARLLQDTGWRPMMTKIVAVARLYTHSSAR